MAQATLHAEGLAGAANAWAQAEQVMRDKWLSQLRGFVVNAGLPIVALMRESCSSEVLMASVGQGGRARTFRRRVIANLRLHPGASCFHQMLQHSWIT